MSDVETARSARYQIRKVTNHLYLVDGSGYIFRAYHQLAAAHQPARPEPSGAVYGYTAMLWKLADALEQGGGADPHGGDARQASSTPSATSCTTSTRRSARRAPEDLVPQFPLIRDATRAFSLPCIEEAGCEADDIIASYTMAATKAGWEVTIVSSDKDLMQLIDRPGVDMLDTMNDRAARREAMLTRSSASAPRKLGDVLALMGDSVDNVPGVPGHRPQDRDQADPGIWRSSKPCSLAAPSMKTIEDALKQI